VAALFAAGALLRVAAMATFWPAWYVNPDAMGYVSAAHGALWSQVGHPVGYPLFLRILHALSNHVALVAVIQHGLGLATAALLYLAARELGANRLVAAVPAAVVLLSGDELFFEQAVLSEAPFAFLLAAMIYAASRSTRGGAGWVVAAGVALGLANSVREVALFLSPVLFGWMLWQGPPSWRRRALRTAGGAAATVAIVVAYVLAQQHATGDGGLSRTGGWSLYARTAQFADCADFTPPAGTAALCEDTPSALRPGPSFYHWNPASPAWKVFRAPPAGNAALGRFARDAVLHQPLTYLGTVAADELRYAGLHVAAERPFGGTGPGGLVFGSGGQFRAQANAILAPVYSDVEAQTAPGSNALEAYQRVIRLHPALLGLLVLLSLSGLASSAGRARAAVALFGGTALVLLVVPPLVLIWAWRYGVPAHGLLAGAGAFAAAGLWRRVSARRASTSAIPAPG
jgi:hypothetical protein